MKLMKILERKSHWRATRCSRLFIFARTIIWIHQIISDEHTFLILIICISYYYFQESSIFFWLCVLKLIEIVWSALSGFMSEQFFHRNLYFVISLSWKICISDDKQLFCGRKNLRNKLSIIFALIQDAGLTKQATTTIAKMLLQEKFNVLWAACKKLFGRWNVVSGSLETNFTIFVLMYVRCTSLLLHSKNKNLSINRNNEILSRLWS